MTNQHRKRYLARKNFKTLFCLSFKTRDKIILKHNKKILFGYSLSNYNKKYVNEEKE